MCDAERGVRDSVDCGQKGQGVGMAIDDGYQWCCAFGRQDLVEDPRVGRIVAVPGLGCSVEQIWACHTDYVRVDADLVEALGGLKRLRGQRADDGDRDIRGFAATEGVGAG